MFQFHNITGSPRFPAATLTPDPYSCRSSSIHSPSAATTTTTPVLLTGQRARNIKSTNHGSNQGTAANNRIAATAATTWTAAEEPAGTTADHAVCSTAATSAAATTNPAASYSLCAAGYLRWFYLSDTALTDWWESEHNSCGHERYGRAEAAVS